METRSTQRRPREEHSDADLYVRPPIRGARKSTIKDNANKTKNSLNNKITSGLDDRKATKDNTGDFVTSKQNASDPKKKVNVPNSKKPATVRVQDRSSKQGSSGLQAILNTREEDVHNHSGSEYSNEEESSNEEVVQTSLSKGSVKSRPIDDQREVEGDQSSFHSLRSRIVTEKAQLMDRVKNDLSFSTGEQEKTVNRSQLRKAGGKEQPLIKKQKEAYSDDEEDQPKPESERGDQRIPIFTVLSLVFVALVLVASFWMLVWAKPATNEAEKKLQVLTTFQDSFRKLQMGFTSQSPHLWQRSLRILELQLLNGNENREPAIILLTAAQDAEQMLHCVSEQLAKIFASALNSSYTGFSGLEINSEDSEDVKMDIDKRLSEGFQTNDKAAVLHRIELLPPGSLIILYKYCDHENAAFKNIALVLTVLLKTPTLKPDIELKELEETVHDFLKDTFINQVGSAMSHNQMDGDKLGGLWSRISHVVLPVLPEKSPVKECGVSQASS